MLIGVCKMSVEVMNWIKGHDMLYPGDKVLCAVSGGVDSIVLLHMLNSMKDKLGVEVMAAHFNHCIRGAESDRDEKFVDTYCYKHNIKCFIGSNDVPAYADKHGYSMEEAARILRYEFLEYIASREGAKIATAHHADDNLETILINMIHGTSTSGLSGIPPVRGNIIRPMLCLTRMEISEYAYINGLEHVEDSTNSSDDYLRNRIRHKIMPILKEENFNICKGMLYTSELVRDDNMYIMDINQFISAGRSNIHSFHFF